MILMGLKKNIIKQIKRQKCNCNIIDYVIQGTKKAFNLIECNIEYSNI
jgi:hypothetical protein